MDFNWTIISFVFFLGLMTLIGIYSSTKKKETTTDYLLANREVGTFATALSAVSTCHSGFMFIGLIGFTYVYGVSTIWMILGWVIGDLLAWQFYKPLRVQTEKFNLNTISAFIAGQTNNPKKSLVLKLTSIFIIFFLGLYAAAQLTAGSKALSVMLGWNYSLGIIVGGLIVTIYCFSGGVRASIWTDVVQSVIMMAAMFLLSFIAIQHCGGLFGLFENLNSINPSLVNLKPLDAKLGFVFYMIGWITYGFGVLGQPHVVVRAMAIKSAKSLTKARLIYFAWHITFSLAALSVGLCTKVLMPGLGNSDTELALPMLASELLPQILIGVILAGIFSATISTADSQVLSCSASMTQDLFPKWKNSYNLGKFATLVSMIIIITLALLANKNVFDLAIMAWSSLAAIIVPLMVLRCSNVRVTEFEALQMIVTGFTVVVIWRYLDLASALNEMVPALTLSFAVFGLNKLLPKQKDGSSKTLCSQ